MTTKTDPTEKYWDTKVSTVLRKAYRDNHYEVSVGTIKNGDPARRIVARVRNEKESAPHWSVELGEWADWGNTPRPAWCRTLRREGNRGYFGLLREAVARAEQYHEVWCARHDPTPREVQARLELAYTVPRDGARKADQNLRAAMLRVVKALRDHTNTLESSIPDREENAVRAAHTFVQRMDYVGRMVESGTIMGAVTNAMALRLQAAEAAARLSPERVRELDDEDIARRVAERMGVTR